MMSLARWILHPIAGQLPTDFVGHPNYRSVGDRDTLLHPHTLRSTQTQVWTPFLTPYPQLVIQTMPFEYHEVPPQKDY